MLPTISELGNQVRRGERSVGSAAILATDRRTIGLCDECDRKYDGDPEVSGLCKVCLAKEKE